jgi:hypothetical protein
VATKEIGLARRSTAERSTSSKPVSGYRLRVSDCSESLTNRDHFRRVLQPFRLEHLRRSARRDPKAVFPLGNLWDRPPFVAKFVVGNPLKIKAIAEAKIKTDKVNAEVPAQLLRCDFLPSVWQPDDRIVDAMLR